MSRRNPATSIADADLRRAANALRKSGKPAEAKRLERNLPTGPKEKKNG